ncbi:MAG: hypothetical protein HY738_00595 [Bacteroidia bacterium]|nr:hypothetical protein [Bacteroidia bacterium]
MTTETTSYKFESAELLNYIKLKRKPLFIITLAGLIVSAIISFFVTPLYKSTVVLYPVASTSISNALLSDKIVEKELLSFGEEEEGERLLQILNSSEIRDRIAHKYNLMGHYNIDPASKYPKTMLNEKYKHFITFRRTEFMSIEIEVYDKDAVIAANIANDIALLVDTIMNKMQKERAIKALRLVEHEYYGQINRIKFLEDSLTTIRKKGVIYYESMAEMFNDAYANAIADGKSPAIINKLEQKLGILADYGGTYVILRDLLFRETEKLSIIEYKYKEAKIDVEQDLPHTYIVNKAEVAEKKSLPIRWLIILVSTLSVFILALFCLLITDSIKKKTYAGIYHG